MSNRQDETGRREMIGRRNGGRKRCSDNGVKHIFGYPGGAVLPIYDELFQQEEVQHILVRHEQGAGHAAEGYARSTGKAGVMLVTSGPGATNAVTPLQDALMDSIPLVCITGQVPTIADRLRCLPGMRHGRHHPALHQAQLAGQGRQRAVRHPPRGLPRRHHRSAGTGRRRHPEGRPVRQGHLHAAADGAAHQLPAEGAGRPRQDQGRRRAACRRPSGR